MLRLLKHHDPKEEEQIFDLCNGDKIKITGLPSCRNVPKGTLNPYVGMEGTVRFLDHDSFDLFTGTCWLVGIKIKGCRYEKLK